MKKITFKVPIYGCRVIFIVSKDFRKSAKKLKHKSKSSINGNCGVAIKLHGDCLDYLIMVKPRYKKDWETITHEALHITNFILDDRGVGVNVVNDEAQAYLLGFIMGKIQKGRK